MYVIWAHHTSGSGALFNWDSRLGFTNKSVRLDFFAGGWVWKLDGGPQKREAPKCCLIVNFWGIYIYIYVNMLHLRAWKRLACVDRKWLYNCNWGRILAPSYSRHNDLSKNLTKQDNTQKNIYRWTKNNNCQSSLTQPAPSGNFLHSGRMAQMCWVFLCHRQEVGSSAVGSMEKSHDNSRVAWKYHGFREGLALNLNPLTCWNLRLSWSLESPQPITDTTYTVI